MKRNNSISVIGAGSWGTALAQLLCGKGYDVTLWAHRKEHVEELKSSRKNKKYLPDLILDSRLEITDDLNEAVKGNSLICMVVPSQGYRQVFKKCLDFVEEETTFISAVKGIENTSLQTMTEVMEEEIQNAKVQAQIELAVLSGPSFAKEVARDIPTAVTIGAKNLETARNIQKIFGTDTFRVYASQDVIGLEISAAFKNIIAIATGICDGLGYGMNTRAALITRGLAEISRYGMVRGADPKTFSGLSGMGDLILTCTGELSRNRTVGLQLGQGKELEEILESMGMVAEGVKTTLSAYNLTQEQGIEMPILEQVYQILYEKKRCDIAVKDLLKRELKEE